MKYKNKEKKFSSILSKNIILSIGGLALVIGMPISLVISCSATVLVENKIAIVVTNIPEIKPSNNGEFTEDFDGWDIIAVDKDSLGESETPKLTNLTAGDKYRLKFTLKTGYIVPSSIVGFTIDSIIDGVYYSDVFVFTEIASSLLQTEIEAFYATSGATISETFDGWNIKVVSSLKNDNNEYNELTSLISGDEYKLEFTLIDNYILDKVIANTFLIYENDSYYTTKTYIFVNYAELVDASKLNSIQTTNTGEINMILDGWEIIVVDSVGSTLPLTNLIADTSYYFKFTLLDGFTVPIGLSLTLSDDSYYSSEQFFKVEAEDFLNLENILIDDFGNITEIRTGWAIMLVDSVGSSTQPQSLVVGTVYYIRFDILDGFIPPNIPNNVNYDSGSAAYYYTFTYLKQADDITAFEVNNINELAIFNHSFEGWVVVAVDTIISNQVLNSLSANDMYLLKFSLKPGYLLPDQITGLTLDDNGTYYSSIATFTAMAAELNNLDTITPNSDAKISETFTGWNVIVVNSIESNSEVSSLRAGSTWHLRFELLSGFTEPDNLNNELYYQPLSNSYYYTQEGQIFTESAADVLDLASIGVDENAEVSQSFEGWDISVVNQIETGQIVLNSLAPEDTYFLKFTLKDYYLLPDTPLNGLTLNSGDDSYYSSEITVDALAMYAADIEANTLINVEPNENGVISNIFNGWNVVAVTITEPYEVLQAAPVGTEFLLRFSLQDGFTVSNSRDGLVTFIDGAYYSAQKIIKGFASSITGASGFIDGVSTNELGEVIGDFESEGWDIEVVLAEAPYNLVGEFSTSESTEYRFKFTLLPGYNTSILRNYPNLVVDGVYYSEIETYVVLDEAEDITELANILPTSTASIVDTFIGWDITVVDGIGSTQVISSLSSNDGYYLRFTLQVGYFAASEIDGLTLDSDGSYYSNTEITYGDIAFAFSDVLSILPDASGTISGSYNGWDITVVGSLEEGAPKLTELSVGTPYFVKFTLQEGYYPSDELVGITFKLFGSYYSLSASLFGDIAVSIPTLEEITSDAGGTLSVAFDGWEVTVVGSIGENGVRLTELSVGTPYFLKFTLQEGYNPPEQDQLIGVGLNIFGSYYSLSVKYFGEAAFPIVGIGNIRPDSSGNISSSIIGWNITAVSSIGSTTPLDSLTAGTPYYLKFTLIDEYYALPSLINFGVTKNEADGAYYSNEVINYEIAADDITSLDGIIPDSAGNISTAITSQFTGWDITAVSALGGSTQASDISLFPYNPYFLKFTLQTGYYAPEEREGLTIWPSNGSYYSLPRTTTTD